MWEGGEAVTTVLLLSSDHEDAARTNGRRGNGFSFFCDCDECPEVARRGQNTQPGRSANVLTC